MTTTPALPAAPPDLTRPRGGLTEEDAARIAAASDAARTASTRRVYAHSISRPAEIPAAGEPGVRTSGAAVSASP